MLSSKITVSRAMAAAVVLLSVFLGPDFVSVLKNAILMTTAA